MQAYRTALVTGASSGIGEAFARQLAASGCDLVVVARRTDRLDALAAELGQRHGIHVEVLGADLTDTGDLAQVEKRVADPERRIELLVNNAGFATSGKFAKLPVDREEREIQLNVTALMRLTHAAVGGMSQLGHGGVLNVSSLAGSVAAPGVATYNATKAFVSMFSESLHMELKSRGVHVTALLPGFTRTEFQGKGGIEASGLPDLAWLDADMVARAGLRAVSAGDAICVPGLQYAGAASLLRFVPRRVLHQVVPRVWRRV